MITKIGTAGVYVEDQKKAIRFWTEKIGFELRVDRYMGNAMSWVEVAPPGAQSCLVLYPRKLMPNYAELKPSLVFNCDNIDEFCHQLKIKGVKFSKELATLRMGKFAAFLDEDGNEFGLREEQNV